MSPWIVVARAISSVVWRHALRVSPLLLAGLLLGAAAFAQDAGTGSLRGRVIDAAVGTPLDGVDVTLVSPGGETSRTTDAQGGFEFTSVPAAEYEVRFRKSGYRDASLERVAVRAGAESRADMSLPAAPTGAAPAEPVDIEEFVVVASPLAEILAASRMSSDELINTLGAEDFSKFAASDVADALKFVPGVNVVEGQFAIIRGLEDRYSSTLYNFASVPSPDPDSQSVQLDLFPADVVGDLVVAKTFGPDLPGNSSGGSINIITHDYPEEFELKLSGGGGFETKALERFLRFDEGSPIGVETEGWDVAERDWGGSIGGRRELFDRELRFKALVNREVDYRTGEGFQEGREPRRSQFRRFPPPGSTVASGDLALGELNLSDGRFELTESERSQQDTGYLGIGADLDSAGDHQLDGSVFYTKKTEEVVQLTENGYLPNFDYSALAAKQRAGQEIDRNADYAGFATPSSWIARTVRGSANDAPSRGPLWFANFNQSESFDRERDLRVFQLNGDHTIELLDGLHVSWVANRAKTEQTETSLGARYFFEPDDPTVIPDDFPVGAGDLGDGQFFVNNGIFQSSNDITEKQRFARIDVDYERSPIDELLLRVNGGLWYERSKRSVDSTFLENPSVLGSTQFAIGADTPGELGETLFGELDRTEDGLLSGLRQTTNDSTRKIKAWNVGGKATFFDRLDLMVGVRRESVFIESLNDPFTGEPALDGTPAIFPTKYLFFDRLDNRSRGEVSRPPAPGTTFNDQLLGIVVPVDPDTGFVDLTDQAQIEAFVNGEIDRKLTLPSYGFTLRPIEGLALRGAYSRTVARPSFREMGYYVTVEPGTDDLIVGNPQLQLSQVRSFDLRAEYSWGELGDLVAVSLFRKRIDDPIESIIVRNPANADGASSALFRTFFNNPNQGKLRGIEVEGRKSLDFLGVDLLQYLSIGANYTYIDAEVGRTEVELARSATFFGLADGDTGEFEELEPTRRLFGQPKWIANADLSFDHPDWGTKVTLSFFAISDILDAAGVAALNNNGDVISFTLDRYVDSFHQLDLVMSQTWHVEALRGDVTLKASVKNLTNSRRSIVYDQEQTGQEITERAVKIGRDFSFSVTYEF